MRDRLLETSIEEIRNGYSYDSTPDSFVCNICGRVFENGEVFEVNGRYFDAQKMTKIHIHKEHGNMLDILASYDKKYTGLTGNQKELLKMIYAGMSDSQIAKENGVAAATIRHQRFIFREKAKQAKLYLAIYELAMQGAEPGKPLRDKSEEMIDIHRGATMVDDRYFITKAEEEKILSNVFSSLSPPRLKIFSAKEKNKVVILKKIAEQFELNRKYSEKELNGIIREIYDDYATIRRYLIEYGFMDRTIDCREYWLK